MAIVRKNNTSPMGYLLFLLFLLILAAALVMLWPVYNDYRKKSNELDRLKVELNNRREQAGELNAEVAKLKRSPEAVEKVAREKFGLVKDNEKVIRYPVDGKLNNNPNPSN